MDRIRGLWLAYRGGDAEKQARIISLILLLVAFSLRLAAALIIPLDYRLELDALRYITIARHIVTLGVFGVEPGVPYALIPPGYPVFVAIVFALTNQSLLIVRLTQVVLGTLIVWLTYLIGREASSRPIGLLSALIGALYPVWIIWSVLFLTETLYAVLLLAFTWCLIRSLKTCTTKYAILTGASFGLALLTREVFFFFPLLLPLALWIGHIPWQRAWRYLVVFAVIALVVLSPWLTRNALTFGQIFYTERLEALRYTLTGSGYLSPYYAHLADDEGGDSSPSKPLSEATQRRHELYGAPSEWLNVRFLLSDPATYLRHLINRFVELWLHPNGLESLPDNWAIRAVYVALHVGMLGLAGIGLVVGLRRRDQATGVIGLLLAYTTGVLLFFRGPIPRYTLPFLPMIFVLAASGTVWLLQFVARKKAAHSQPTGDL